MNNKVILDRELFAEALGKVEKFIEKKNVIPVFESVLLEIGSDTVSITGGNAAMQARAFSPCNNSGAPFSICVPCNTLYGMISLYRENTVTLTQKSDKVVELKCGKSKCNISMDVQPEFFNIMKMAKMEGEITLHQSMLTKALKSTKAFVDPEHPNQNLSVINIKEVKNKIVFTGASKVIMCRVAIRPISIGAWTSASISVPLATRIIGLIGEKGEIIVSVGDKKIRFGSESFEVIGVTYDGTFPNTEQFFDKQSTHFITINALEFRDSVKRLRYFKPIDEDSAKFTLINSELSTQELVLRAVDAMGGKNCEEQISITNPHQYPIDKCWNAEYMLDVLGMIDSSEVNLFFDEKHTSFLIPRVDNPEEDIYTFLIASVVQMTKAAV